ncbi:hypothetical protein BaRGS_00015906, partial [Batillaria attramentaria]
MPEEFCDRSANPNTAPQVDKRKVKWIKDFTQVSGRTVAGRVGISLSVWHVLRKGHLFVSFRVACGIDLGRLVCGVREGYYKTTTMNSASTSVSVKEGGKKNKHAVDLEHNTPALVVVPSDPLCSAPGRSRAAPATESPREALAHNGLEMGE